MQEGTILKIKHAVRADSLLEIPGTAQVLIWASDYFQNVLALSHHHLGIRNVVQNDNVIIIDEASGRGTAFLTLHLYGRAMAIIHQRPAITPYQVVMVYLRQLLTSDRVVCVIVENARHLEKIVAGLLDESRFDLSWIDNDLIIRVI